MGENVNDKISTRLQGARNLRHQELIILHVFEKFDRYHTIKSTFIKFVVHDISSQDPNVRKSF